MIRNHRAPLTGVDPLQVPPPPSGQLAKPTFQPGSILYEAHGSAAQVTNKFRCGRLLGRGGFAKCYEVYDTKGTYALKAINRASLEKPKTLQKLHSEIAIHSRMKHKHIVNFIRTFKDRYYVYILLEKCDNGTLMDLLKVRPLNVGETQFVMLQCLSAMQYMHDQSVIHRDLKPGNIMLDSELNVKIGDFGLAAELAFDGERKRTVCGTPNYIAPEIIDRKSLGHSFEVDTWSLGVILYTLLVGQPPFQMEDVESTYSRIRACRYDFPSTVPENARDLIRRILQSSPTNRPNLLDIRTHPFFSSPVPSPLPPPSFTGYGLILPARGSGAQSADANVGSAAPVSGRRAADVELGYGSGKPTAQAQREILRPINTNNINHNYYNAPVLGGPVSPRTGANVVQKLPPPPLNNVADGNYFGAKAPGGSTTPPPPTSPSSATSARRFAAVGALQANAHTRNTWRANGGYDLRFPNIDGRGSNSPTKENPPAEEKNTANEPRRPRRAPRREAEDDEEEDHRQLTQLHDRLHQTLCVHDGEDDDAKVTNADGAAGTRKRDEPAAEEEEGSEEQSPSPEVWVTECADFSNKYGVCYRLSSGHTGAHFNDSTKMVWEPITGRVEYYARVRVEVPQANGEPALFAKDQLEAFNMSDYPDTLEKKITLIKYFKTYLSRTRSPKDKVEVVPCSTYLAASPPRLSDPHVSEDFIYVKRWLRTPEALVFRLSNKTVQVCFNDKADVILSSEWKVVTYTDPTGQRRTLPLASVATESAEAAERLRYTKTILYKLIKDHCL